MVRNRQITIDQKVELWHQTPEWIVEKCPKKGYLIKTKNKRRVSKETAKKTLSEFISESEWLVIKCSFGDTQSNESFNAIKSRICPKNLIFTNHFVSDVY